MEIRRALPARGLRTVGAWCFLDHFGPADTAQGRGMRVGPHPHTGLQTLTWLLDGEVLHRDSLGCVQLIRPGQVNLMTAGRAIAHSEESPEEGPPILHGAQMWIALPDADRQREPAFDHYPVLPVVERGGLRATIFAGEALGERAPTRVYSPLAGIDLDLREVGNQTVALNPAFEYAAMALQGAPSIEDEPLPTGALLRFRVGRATLRIRANAPARLLLLGGEPFAAHTLMWWNFVGRTRGELAQWSREWNAGENFGEVRGYDGPRLVAPLPP